MALTFLKLVFTSDRVRVVVGALVKIENWSHKRNHKPDGIGVVRIRMLSFLPIPFKTVTYDPVRTRLSKSHAEVKEQTNYKSKEVSILKTKTFTDHMQSTKETILAVTATLVRP